MNQTWMDYSLKMPFSGIVDAGKARAKLAAQMETSPELAFDRRILHYREDGHPIEGMSPFRFGGGGTFHIYASGTNAVNLLSAEAHKITSLFSKAYDELLVETRKQGIYKVCPAKALQTYNIGMMVLQQKPAHHKLLMQMDGEQRNEYAEKLIRTGIEAHIAMLGLEQDDMGAPRLLIGDTRINGDLYPVSVKPGVWFLAARDVTFRTNYKLDGVFHVGHLISRGYGKISPARKGVGA